MSNLTIRNLFLITCIAGVAAVAAASFGHSKKSGIIAPASDASTAQTTPQMCAASIRSMASPANKYRSRHLAQTPVSYIARRSR